VTVADEREQLATVVRSQVQEQACWERAEGHLQAEALRERLAALHVDITPDLAVGLMAAAMLLAEQSPEWGGDYRDALGAVAALGFGLLGDQQ
jgi:hypothetical protein